MDSTVTTKLVYINSYNKNENKDCIHGKKLWVDCEATGRNKNWYNIQIINSTNLEGEKISINPSQVSCLNVIESIDDYEWK